MARTIKGLKQLTPLLNCTKDGKDELGRISVLPVELTLNSLLLQTEVTSWQTKAMIYL